MKITIEIKDDASAGTFINFIKSLDYINILSPKKVTEQIPDWHIAILQQRLSEYKKNPASALDFDKAMKDLESEL